MKRPPKSLKAHWDRILAREGLAPIKKTLGGEPMRSTPRSQVRWERVDWNDEAEALAYGDGVLEDDYSEESEP